MDILSINFLLALFSVGIFAGIINIMAGGGSNLTIPMLMLMGLPADVANATNRLGVLSQSISGSYHFYRHKKLVTHDLKPILIPTLIGALIGAGLASFLPAFILKYLLLGTMVSMSAVLLFKPSMIIPADDERYKNLHFLSPTWFALVLAGAYGGFVQAGVGFVLLSIFSGALRYSLSQANALKLVCSFAFTAASVIIFTINNQIMWIPGIILAIGTTFGAYIGVRISLNLKQETLKWILFTMTVCACLAALFKI